MVEGNSSTVEMARSWEKGEEEKEGKVVLC